MTSNDASAPGPSGATPDTIDAPAASPLVEPTTTTAADVTAAPAPAVPTAPRPASDEIRFRPLGATGLDVAELALGTWGLISFMMRNVRDAEALRPLLGASIVGHVLGVIVTLWALMEKSIGPMAWSSVVIYGLLGIGAWMCLAQQGTHRAAAAA